MKEQIDKIIELSNKLTTIAQGNNVEYLYGDIQVWYSDGEEPGVKLGDLIEVTYWTKNRNETELNIKDVARLSELPGIILNVEKFLIDFKNSI